MNAISASRPPSTSDGNQTVTTTRSEIIFFGRLEERKGLLEFVDAVVGLEAAGVTDFSVTFVGKDVRLYSARTGRASSSEYIRRRLAGTHFPFRILPDFSSEEAIGYVKASPSSVVCLASPSDNFPNTGLEMAQIAAPLVVSDTTGFHQTLKLAGRREGVFWFKPTSAASLRTALSRALAALTVSIAVPSVEAIQATNARLAEERFKLIENAFAAARPDWLPTNWLARVFILAGGDARAVRATRRSLEGSAANIIDVIVLALVDWSAGELEDLQQAFPRIVFRPADQFPRVLAEGPPNTEAASCQSLLLVCAGTTLQPSTVRDFIEAEVRTKAALVTAAQWEGPRQDEVRSFGPASVPLLLQGNNASGSCVLINRSFLESLPPPVARTPQLLIWQLTLAAAVTGAKIAYIPYPQYALGQADAAGERNAQTTDRELAGLARYAASIKPDRWARRELFGLALATQQLGGSLRQARAESHEHQLRADAIQAALHERQNQLSEAEEARKEAERHWAGARQELAAVYSSKSWRWTCGLRLFYRSLAAVKARLRGLLIS
jgi:hypothetical protein